MKLNKRNKAIVTAAAAAALVAGTATTFALWFDTAALGAETQAISTGDLNITADRVGAWRWSHVSNPTIGITLGTPAVGDTPAVPATPFSPTYKLVPGDAVSFDWTSVADTITYAGSTIQVALYLEGEDGFRSAIPAPLVLQVGGVTANATGSITITRATDGTWNFPSILVGFPVDYGTTPPGYGHLPGLNGLDYGRNIGAGTNYPAAVSLNGLTLRLQQTTSGGNVFGPITAG